MFKNWISKIANVETPESERSLDMRQVSAQLMLEVARSDTTIDDVERDVIIKSLLNKSQFQSAELEDFMAQSEQAVESSISFHEHVRLINDELDHSQKVKLIEQMWRIAYADGKLDALEEAGVSEITLVGYLSS